MNATADYVHIETDTGEHIVVCVLYFVLCAFFVYVGVLCIELSDFVTF